MAAPGNKAAPSAEKSPWRRPYVLWRRIARKYRRVHAVRWLALGVLAGVGSGLLAVAYYLGVEGLRYLLQVKWAGLSLPSPAGESLLHGAPGVFRPWLIPVFTTLVGLVTGALVTRFIPESVDAGTDGTDATIKAFHRDAGLIRPLTPLIRGATSILTLAAGGSAGREGPISQLGAGLGSLLAAKFRLTARERRLLLLAGAAGGLGAIFRAPLGAAVTAIEVLYAEDFEAAALLPAVISSVVAYTVFTFFFGVDAIIATPRYRFENALELPFYAALAVVAALSVRLFLKTFFFVKYGLFARIRRKFGITGAMVAGGLAMGLLGWAFPELLSGGYGYIELSANGQLGILFLAGLFFGKILATSLTIGSGLSGGMFAPALFIGGMAGGAVGQAGHLLRPDIVREPGGYTMVGMAAFFAGAARAPIGPLLMVCEITQGYGLLAPLMLCSALTMLLSGKDHLYENQVADKFESPAHKSDATVNLLAELPVAGFYRAGAYAILEEGTTLKALADIIAGTSALTFPVKNAAGRLSGILTLNDVRKVLFEDCLRELVLVKDLARKPVFLTPDASLYDAMMLFLEADVSQIPVVEAADQDRVLGMLNREDVFKAYSHTIREVAKEA